MGRGRQAFVYLTALVVVVADQITKSLVVDHLAGRPPVNLIGSFVRLLYTTNSGGAFSLFAGAPWFFAIMATLVMVAIVVYARRVDSTVVLVTLGLLLGGALGNYIDRLWRGPGLFHGEVVDFVDVGPWPVFNVADSCVTIGAILLALLIGRAGRAPADDGDDGEPATERSDPDARPTSR
jgi:signal peptidase II